MVDLKQLNSSQAKAVLLMGPTASGKTQLALDLAKYYPIEIISVDSALVYHGMNIGTAKPRPAELAMVPHHLIDIITPLQTYCVADFVRDSIDIIKRLNQSGKLPILVGGTMMYFNGLINGISNLPPANTAIRAKLEQRGLTEGWDILYQELQQIDSIAANKIKPKDKQRVTRALEVFYLTGLPISQLQQQTKYPQQINFLPLAILPQERVILHQRIEQRFDKMLHQGLIEEVEQLQKYYPQLNAKYTSMRSVGYAQAWEYLAGELSFTQFREASIAATRQLAKRQITWLRSMDIINLDINNNLLIENLFQQILLRIKLFLD